MDVANRYRCELRRQKYSGFEWLRPKDILDRGQKCRFRGRIAYLR